MRFRIKNWMITISALMLLNPAQSAWASSESAGTQETATAAGSQCGVKIAAALAALPGPGRVEAPVECDHLAASVNLQLPHLARNQHLTLASGTYTVSAPIVLGSNASIECPLSTGIPAAGYGTCIFQQAAGKNLPAIVILSGINAVLSNVTVDGNRSQNPTGGVNIQITGLRARLDHVSTINAETHGIQIGSSIKNQGAGAKLDHVMAIGNGGDGIFCQNVGDVFVGGQSEFELNARNGIEADNCAAWRILGNDFGSNLQSGIKLTGNSGAWLINANQFGGNQQHDIDVQGWNNGHYASLYNVINGNEFVGAKTTSPGTYDAIHLQDSAFNSITSNVCFDVVTKRSINWCVGLYESTPGREYADAVAGNVSNGMASGNVRTVLASVPGANSDGEKARGKGLQATVRLATPTGGCATATVLATGAIPGRPVAWSLANGVLLDPQERIDASVTALDTITVRLCTEKPDNQLKAINVEVLP